MRLGPIQRAIVEILHRHGAEGAYTRPRGRHPELGGYFLEEVERSLAALKRRGIVEQVSSVRHRLVSAR